MTDERTFQQSIVAWADDISPRLVFADWLEERIRYNDDDLAKHVNFIRDPAPWRRSTRTVDGRFRLRQIRNSIPGFPKSYRIVLLAEPMRFDQAIPLLDRCARVFVRHGYIEQICVSQWVFIRIAKALFAHHPVRDVFLGLQDPTWPDFVPDRRRQYCWMQFGTPTDLRIGSFPQSAVVWPIFQYLGAEKVQQLALYDSPQAAYADLSAACRWGRELAD